MKHSRLHNLIASFTSREVKDFADFVASPYFNKNERVRVLAHYLLKAHPDLDGLPAEEEQCKVVFPGEVYDYHSFKNLTSDIVELALRFLEIENIQAKDIQARVALLESLRTHKQDKLFERTLKKSLEVLAETALTDPFHMLKMHWVRQEEMQYVTQKDPNTEHVLTQKSFDAFLEYAVMLLCDHYGLMLHEQLQNNVDYRPDLMEEVLAFALQRYDSFTDLTKLYIDMLVLVRDLGNVEMYYRLQKRIREIHADVPYTLLDRVFVHLIDCCAHQMNKLGNNGFLREIHNVHRDLVEFGIQKPENISYPDFLNIVKIATACKEFEWTEAFMQSHGKNLDEQVRDDTIAFSNAFIAYYKDDFAEASRYMSMVNFKNHIMKIQVKQFMLRFMYEQRLWTQMLASVEAFAHYLRREANLPEEMIHGHEEYLNNLRELIKLRLEPNMEMREKRRKGLAVTIENMGSNYFGTRGWLRRKLELDGTAS
ncbi:MAG: hypothetical protein R2794_07305 [Chitinophagales bacterium]